MQAVRGTEGLIEPSKIAQIFTEHMQHFQLYTHIYIMKSERTKLNKLLSLPEVQRFQEVITSALRAAATNRPIPSSACSAWKPLPKGALIHISRNPSSA